MSMEKPEAAPDLVGRTSARLLAAGVDRRERLEALHLLAILDASVDSAGRVRRPVDDLAGEFDLPTLSVLRSLDHLEVAGALKRNGGHVELLGNNPEGLGGMQLADFLDDVRASFDDDRDDAHDAPRRSPWLVRSGAALVAAAAAVAVLTLAPAQTATEQPLALTDVSTSTTDAALGLPAPDLSTPVEPIQPTTTIVAPVTAPGDAGVIAAEASCPTGSPVAELVDGLLHITNPTDEELEITSVSVGATLFEQTITVAPGETVTRAIAGSLGPVATDIVSWEWTSGTVARSCPS